MKPQMVIEAEFRGITHDGLLRQASFKGLREDKPARVNWCAKHLRLSNSAKAAMARRQPVREIYQSPSQGAVTVRKQQQKKDVEIAGVRLTHPDRVYWDDAGVTKERPLPPIMYRAWDVMAPHIVRSRPLAGGVALPGRNRRRVLFPKAHRAERQAIVVLRRVVKAKEHDVIAVEKLDDLIELVQSGALEIHVRGSRLDGLESCDRIVFDLDPGEGVTWKAIVDAAKEIRDRLAELKLKSFAKLSGGKGIHIVLPIDGANWDTTKVFTAKIAAAMAADSLENFTSPK